MTVKELIEKRANAWENAKEFLDSHRNENGILSAEDSATYDRMEKDITDYSKEIERLNRQQAIDNELGKPVGKPLSERPGMEMGDNSHKSFRASNEYRNAALSALRCNFSRVSDVLQEGVDSDGGYLVPEEWDKRLIESLEEENIFRKMATVIKTSGEHKINIASSNPAASWIEEGTALDFGHAYFEQKILDAHKLHVAIKVTEELLYDNAFGLESYINRQFGKALGNAEEYAFLNGDGKGKPYGIFDSLNGGTISYMKGTKIKPDDIISLIYRLKRPYRKNASFIMNDTFLAEIRKLKDNNGAYMWQPAYKEGEPDRLAGYKVYTSAYAPTARLLRSVMAFGDYSYYNIGDRGTRSFQALREIFAGNGMVGYVAKERVDGILVQKEAVQVLAYNPSDISSMTDEERANAGTE